MCNKISNFRSQISNSPGFTLLEIMIALAIIGMTLMTVLHTVNYHARITDENTISTQITQLAKEKLFDLETNPVSSSGDIEGTGFTYENTVSATEDPEIIELETVVRGKGKEAVLREIIRNTAGPSRDAL